MTEKVELKQLTSNLSNVALDKVVMPKDISKTVSQKDLKDSKSEIAKSNNSVFTTNPQNADVEVSGDFDVAESGDFENYSREFFDEVNKKNNETLENIRKNIKEYNKQIKEYEIEKSNLITEIKNLSKEIGIEIPEDSCIYTMNPVELKQYIQGFKKHSEISQMPNSLNFDAFDSSVVSFKDNNISKEQLAKLIELCEKLIITDKKKQEAMQALEKAKKEIETYGVEYYEENPNDELGVQMVKGGGASALGLGKTLLAYPLLAVANLLVALLPTAERGKLASLDAPEMLFKGICEMLKNPKLFIEDAQKQFEQNPSMGIGAYCGIIINMLLMAKGAQTTVSNLGKGITRLGSGVQVGMVETLPAYSSVANAPVINMGSLPAASSARVVIPVIDISPVAITEAVAIQIPTYAQGVGFAEAAAIAVGVAAAETGAESAGETADNKPNDENSEPEIDRRTPTEKAIDRLEEYGRGSEIEQKIANDIIEKLDDFPNIDDRGIDKVMKKAKNVAKSNPKTGYSAEQLNRWLEEQNSAAAPKVFGQNYKAPKNCSIRINPDNSITIVGGDVEATFPKEVLEHNIFIENQKAFMDSSTRTAVHDFGSHGIKIEPYKTGNAIIKIDGNARVYGTFDPATKTFKAIGVDRVSIYHK